MSQPGIDRFDSWKEIAAHLKRDLRTVRRWESERGLPVHRVPGSGRRVVFAYRSEIDVWLHESNATKPDIPVRSDPVPRTHEENYKRLSENTSSPFVQLGVIGLALIAASLVVFALRTQRVNGKSGTSSSEERMSKPLVEPEVASVTQISPRSDQTIIIKGRGFGWFAPFTGLDTPFLAIRDITGHWAAGRIIDRNPDDVTLNVVKWIDSEIVITGFSGKYGQENWKLQPGDDIDIAVWNPQTGAGPAIFRTVCNGKDKGK